MTWDEDQDDVATFMGRWRVRRRIFDARAGQVLVFEGTAVISPERFEETGIVRSAGREFSARRSYSLGQYGRSVVVRFSDDRMFISLTPESIQTVEHRCGDDHYRGGFIFADRDRWSEAWHVFGPRKDYRSTGRFVRA